MSYSSQNDACCPISCAGMDLIPRDLFLVKRCVPIQALCNSLNFDLFVDNGNLQPSGVITFVNKTTCPDCQMTADITDNGVITSYSIGIESSVTIEVSNLEMIVIECNSTVQANICTGTLEMDLQYKL
ncbi:S-Ena type endospore appendage [Chengkuizengella axinellae]|uniref:Endospore appendages core domain-containing protein n=1 Tax=Chengkuizengella axinellae TaxID=3064388 RepID=A0ABT9ITW4_9BACL|nr:S-Ena type endospore appendage [Chengkuizengella sp. 2205SS18-9]MDP5272794.1 hypothetical protein [Chengkuizengella sp. 2205SS18-9]